MNYEEIGKRAVELGYDGGGIWSNSRNLVAEWVHSKVCKKNRIEAGCWPDFSYPETEGAALAWILDKLTEIRKETWPNIRIHLHISGYIVMVESTVQFEYRSRYFPTKVEAILNAIESLGLRKKDNRPMGLNKRLLEVGFRSGGCVWYTNRDSSIIVSDAMIIAAMESGCVLFPDGSHPSTIGVATAWLRSFPKIGNTFHIVFVEKKEKWLPHIWGDFFGESALSTGFDTEIEALVEFAEWAKEQGLMND